MLIFRMQEIRSSNTPVVAGICDPNKSRVRHHRSFVFCNSQVFASKFLLCEEFS